MQLVRAPDLPAYLKLLTGNADEMMALYNDLLIAVTGFFRDPNAFAVLEKEIVPGLFSGKTSEDTVRVWVTGCATGEEAYSVAILLCEEAEKQVDPPGVQIFATDVHERSFAFARQALYSESIASDVSAQRLDRFFIHESRGYRLKKVIRQKVVFAKHNLLSDPPFLRLDLITCRNILIYLKPAAQRRIFEIFHFGLRPGGTLFLGTSESVEDASRRFTVIDSRHRIFRTVGRAQVPSIKPSSSPSGLDDDPGGERPEPRKASPSRPRRRKPDEVKPRLDVEPTHPAGRRRFLSRPKSAAAELIETNLDRISASARHLAHMIDDSLQSVRIEAGITTVENEPTDLSLLVREVGHAIEPLMKAKMLEFEVDTEEALVITVDATKLRQILYNVLGNAVRYTDTGRVVISSSRDGESAVISVEDTGIGISPDNLERIFERFWQADQSTTRVRGGAGLGLMVSRSLARIMGGDILAASNLGRGSCFTSHCRSRVRARILAQPWAQPVRRFSNAS